MKTKNSVRLVLDAAMQTARRLSLSKILWRQMAHGGAARILAAALLVSAAHEASAQWTLDLTDTSGSDCATVTSGSTEVPHGPFAGSFYAQTPSYSFTAYGDNDTEATNTLILSGNVFAETYVEFNGPFNAATNLGFTADTWVKAVGQWSWGGGGEAPSMTLYLSITNTSGSYFSTATTSDGSELEPSAEAEFDAQPSWTGGSAYAGFEVEPNGDTPDGIDHVIWGSGLSYGDGYCNDDTVELAYNGTYSTSAGTSTISATCEFDCYMESYVVATSASNDTATAYAYGMLYSTVSFSF